MTIVAIVLERKGKRIFRHDIVVSKGGGDLPAGVKEALERFRTLKVLGKEKPLSNENGLSLIKAEGKLIDFDPHALTPVTVSAAWLAPPIPVLLAFFPFPIIGHDAELQGRLVIALLFDAPAIAVLIADNSG